MLLWLRNVYHQCFRNLKSEDQTHTEFVWVLAVQSMVYGDWGQNFSGIVSWKHFNNLKTAFQVILQLELLTSQKVKTPQAAAVLANEYILTHKHIWKLC